MIVELNGRSIDLSGVFPLKVRDYKALEAQGINLADGQNPLTQASALAFYVLHKRDPTVTQAEVDDLEITHPAWNAVMVAMQAGGGGVDAPLSKSSTSSAASSGGPSET